MRRLSMWAVLVCFAVVNISGCGQRMKSTEEVIASVNGEKVYASDIRRAMAFKADPLAKVTDEAINASLESLIDKKILIQTAKKERLDEQEKFSNTIKTFWEQTLIRDLIEFKQKEIAKTVQVTEKDIQDYYANLSNKITFKVLKTRNKDIAVKAAKTDAALIKWDQEMGPLSYEDGYSDIILRIFEIPQGKTQILENEEKNFYVVYMAKKEPVTVKALSEMKNEITEKVKARKIQDELKKWLIQLKAGSKIDIKKDVLNSLKLKK